MPREIYIITLCKLINMLGFFVFPFLTLFLTKKMGMTATETGFYTMISGIATIPGSLIGGYLSDKFSRKKVLIIAQFSAASLLLPCAWLGNSMLVPKLLIMSSACNGLAGPASSAMVTDITDTSNRKQSFSLLYLGANLGIAIGTYLAGMLFTNHTRWLFIGDFITTMVSLVLLIALVKETKPTDEQIVNMDRQNEKADDSSALIALINRPILFSFVLISAIFSFIYAQSQMGLPLQMTDLFGEDRGAKLYGSIMFVNAIVVVIATPLFTIMTRKLRPVLNISIGGLLYAAGFGAVYFAKGFQLFVITTVIWTSGEIIIALYNSVFIANHTPISHRGRFNSIIPLITGAGYVTSMRMMGTFIDLHGVRWIWGFLFKIGVIGALMMLILYFVDRKKHKPELLND